MDVIELEVELIVVGDALEDSEVEGLD